jgi:excisionase family DNA binding protein
MTAELEPQRRNPLKPIAVTIGDTRRLTGLGNTTVFQLIKQGTLKSIKVGRRRLVIYNSIKDLLQAD